MRRAIRTTGLLLGIGAVLASWPAGAQTLTREAVGLYMAVVGQTAVVHAGQPAAVPVKLRGQVYFKDVIETRTAGLAKALFDDDSILTVGENSRVEISEYIYDPANNRRSAVLRLVQGKARALVGKLFVGLGSRFEVHTPTAVTAARGTYFVVWIIEEKASRKLGMSEPGAIQPVSSPDTEVAQRQTGGTGVANIGDAGMVAFISEGQTVEVPPGYYSIALLGAPPTRPEQIAANVPLGVAGAIQGTELADAPVQESPNQVVTAVGHATGLLAVEPGPMFGTLVSPSTVTSLQSSFTPPSVISGSSLGGLTQTVTTIVNGVPVQLTVPTVPGGLQVPGVPGIPGVCVSGICLPKLP